MSANASGAPRPPGAEIAAATQEVLSGRPGPAARRWLGRVALAAFALFLADTAIVLQGAVRSSFDVPVEHWVQAFPWGPLAPLMTLTNVSSGAPQVITGIVAVVALLVWERRAGYLMALGSLGSVIDAVLKTSIQRQRPTADLVDIVAHANGYSYPSGHAVFFTWLAFMLAASIAPRLGRRERVLAWAGAGLLILIACTGRVWAGAHWPSDVIGGFLEALAWSAFVLWLPERWLPSPSWRWVRMGPPARRQTST
jgi:undecaprenyl-diphosphatase